jgi:hypothetical protein
MAGTKLVVINEGQDNEAIAAQSDGADIWTYNKRVEVAIVIPADWDERPGHTGNLRPNKPCHLRAHGKFPPVVSLDCRNMEREQEKLARQLQRRPEEGIGHWRQRYEKFFEQYGSKGD